MTRKEYIILVLKNTILFYYKSICYMNGCGHMGGAWSQHDRPCPTRLRLLISRAMSPLVPVLALKTLEETRGPAPAEGCAPGHDPAGRMLPVKTTLLMQALQYK